MSARRRWLVPEVVQTSGMDCGPAVLAALAAGHGKHVHYGRLREACQTDVDGTSIDTLETLARGLGLGAEQVMVPVDHLLLPGVAPLPAILIVRLPSGFTHFVLAWRRHGGWVQVMDPASGRRWLRAHELLRDLYVHETEVPASAWRAYAESDDFGAAITLRLGELGVGRAAARARLAAALAEPGWRRVAALDACTRLVGELVRSRAIRRGGEAERLLDRLLADGDGAVPAAYGSVAPAPPDADGDEQVRMRGAVLVRVDPEPAASEEAEETAPLPPDLERAIAEPPARPLADLWRRLREEGRLAPLALAAALVVLAAGTVLEALLFRALVHLGPQLSLPAHRLVALGAIVVFAGALLWLEVPLVGLMFGLGRRLEARVKLAVLAKLPRLGDRYFHSRPLSDMAERLHSSYRLRELPVLASTLARLVIEMVVTTVALVWLVPSSAPLAIATAVVAAGVPILLQPRLVEAELRARTHLGGLSRFYLDALLGLTAIRTHAAERAVRREHESLLVEWARAGFVLLRWVIGVQGIASVAGFGLAGWLVVSRLARAEDAAAALLIVYWALQLPLLGLELAAQLRQLPTVRNVTLRALEPLGAPEELDDAAAPVTPAAAAPPRTHGVALAFAGVDVRAAGHTILRELDLAIPAGAHVAIVGASGAGKSSLVGLLLGWQRPASGAVLVDGEPLDGAALDRLRRATAWVDPAVQLWNRSLHDNLRYGSGDAPAASLAEVLADAELGEVLERLPGGLQATLGESGALVSGGEGQRVRFGRALARLRPRLVVLDEPFRGLDRAHRQAMLARARGRWHDATLLCVTHDVGETAGFARVLVVEGGQVVEDGAPAELAARPGSRYAAMLAEEQRVRDELWGNPAWRRVHLEGGRVEEAGS